MNFVCLALVLVVIMQFYFNGREREAAFKEREKLVRRIGEPQAVMIENAPKRPKPPTVSSDADYKRLMESRGQIPREG